MKTILCFGDSNTHGTSPHDWSRFDADTRWPGVLRHELGTDFLIIEEGCGGRTTVHDDPIEEQYSGSKNGAKYLRPCLHSHKPIDLVIILLGTNDLKARFNVGAEDIARGAGVLVNIVKNSDAGPGGRPPKVLLVAPPPIAPIEHTPFKEMAAGGEAKSKLFGKTYAWIARENAVDFLDAGSVIQSSPIDAFHWEAAEHAKLAKAIAAKIREILV